MQAAVEPEHLAEHLAVLPAQLEAVVQEVARENINNVSAREDINNVSPTDTENTTTFTKPARVSPAEREEAQAVAREATALAVTQ